MRLQLLKMAVPLVITYATPPACEPKKRRRRKTREREKKKRGAGKRENKRRKEENVRVVSAVV